MLKKVKKMSTLYYFSYYSSQTLIDLGAYAQLRKIWAEIPSQRQDHNMAILKKRVLKQAIKKGQERLKILLNSNKYKDTLEDLIDSSDVEHLAIPKQIDLLSNNISDSKDDPSNPKKDNDFLDRLERQQQCRITLPTSWVPRAMMRI